MNHNQQRSRHPDYGAVVSIEHGWVKTFAFWPIKTISKRWIWLQTIYCRRVWIYNGFTDEPDAQYGTLFDLLTTENEIRN